MSDAHEPGSALAAALAARGCALRADEARALADALIDLICRGVIVAESPEAVPTSNRDSMFASVDGDA